MVGTRRSTPSKARRKNYDTVHSDSDRDELVSRNATKLIDKYMDHKMRSRPTESHDLVRKQSVFNFVPRGSDRGKRKQSTYRKFMKAVRRYRTLIAMVVLVFYIVCGAGMFWAIEKNSKENIENYEKEVLNKSRDLYRDLNITACGTLKDSDTAKDNKCLDIIYKKLYKMNPPTKNINHYWDGLIYVMSCITTIGYGQLVCFTVLGKMITIIYGAIGIALTIYVLRNNGKVALWFCNKVLKLFSCCCCHFCDKMTVSKALVLLCVFWAAGALGIASFEQFFFADAIYFSFVTFSTIGFGDFVPSSPISGGLIITLHFIDLSLVSMVFALIHESMENNFIQVLELLDEGYRKHTATHLLSPAGSTQNLNVTTAREKT